MYFVSFWLLMYFPCNILSRDAIQFFISHKKVNQASIEILKNVDNSTKIWLEYKYIFQSEKDKAAVLNTTLKIGLYTNEKGSTFDFLDCQMTQRNNRTVFRGYSIDIIENLRQTLNIR